MLRACQHPPMPENKSMMRMETEGRPEAPGAFPCASAGVREEGSRGERAGGAPPAELCGRAAGEEEASGMRIPPVSIEAFEAGGSCP